MKGAKYLTALRWAVRFYLMIIFPVMLQAQTKGKDVNAEQFKALLASTPEPVLLDVRTEDEVKSGMIPGAQHMDFFAKGFEKKILTLDKNKTYFLYCAGGGRSGETMEMMLKEGFKNVYNLKGGFNEWVEKKMPVKK